MPARGKLTHSKNPLSFLSNYANESRKGKVLAQDHIVDKWWSQDSPSHQSPVSPDICSSSATLAPESVEL